MMCLTRHVAPGVDSVSWGRRLGRRHLTQTGDGDDDRPKVSADYGYISGDSTPLVIAEDRSTAMVSAAVSMKCGGDPHAARLLAKWIGVPGGHDENEWSVQHLRWPAVLVSSAQKSKPLWTV